MKDEFQQKTYRWQELAVLYAPDLTPHAASKRLTKWVLINKELYKCLIRSGSVSYTHLTLPTN